MRIQAPVLMSSEFHHRRLRRTYFFLNHRRHCLRNAGVHIEHRYKVGNFEEVSNRFLGAGKLQLLAGRFRPQVRHDQFAQTSAVRGFDVCQIHRHPARRGQHFGHNGRERLSLAMEDDPTLTVQARHCREGQLPDRV